MRTPVAILGMAGPEQDVFHVQALDDRAAGQFLALAPENRYDEARRTWLDEHLRWAWVARDLSWALPASTNGAELGFGGARSAATRVADLSELPTSTGADSAG